MTISIFDELFPSYKEYDIMIRTIIVLREAVYLKT